MSNITISEIDDTEGAVKNLRVKLASLGREIYNMREGRALGAEYAFERYTRSNYCGPNYYEQEGPDWGVGTPILSLVFYWPRGENSAVVTLPLYYLCGDWKDIEANRIKEERARLEAEAKERKALLEAQRERDERQQYEALKARYGEPTQ